MSGKKLEQLAGIGQSIWLDYINRDMIESGKLQTWIDNGLKGMTSNPSIFNQVISKGTDYDSRIVPLKEGGKSTFEIYDELTIADIQDAADIFKPVYEQSDRLDGYVSLEINPQLADDKDASIKEGKRLFEKVGRQNVMIKVPATPAGFPVVEELIASGINVNVTLIFSIGQYMDTVEAYMNGVTRRVKAGEEISKVRSVASVFVSRIDTLADKLVDKKAEELSEQDDKQKLLSLKGKLAVANSKMILEKSEEIMGGEDFQELAQKGANWQRVLWGSTSTKNPDYSDIKYVAELIAKPTINTVPEKTLLAFLDHGRVEPGLTGSIDEARSVVETLNEYSISIDEICSQLLAEGVVAFKKAFEELLASIEAKAQQLCPQ